MPLGTDKKSLIVKSDRFVKILHSRDRENCPALIVNVEVT